MASFLVSNQESSNKIVSSKPFHPSDSKRASINTSTSLSQSQVQNVAELNSQIRIFLQVEKKQVERYPQQDGNFVEVETTVSSLSPQKTSMLLEILSKQMLEIASGPPDTTQYLSLQHLLEDKGALIRDAYEKFEKMLEDQVNEELILIETTLVDFLVEMMIEMEEIGGCIGDWFDRLKKEEKNRIHRIHENFLKLEYDVSLDSIESELNSDSGTSYRQTLKLILEDFKRMINEAIDAMFGPESFRRLR